MAVTVAPLTTTVVNAVPGHQTGVSSGINNAVASVGSLLLIAVLGTVALGAFSRSLERHLESSAASPAVIEAVHAARGGFVIPPMPASLSDEERRRVRSIIADSLSTTVRTMLWIAAALALASAASAALTIPGAERPARAPARA